jgi:glycosyl transferase family 25
MLTALATETGIEHVTFEVRNRTKYVAIKKHPSRPLCSLYQGRRGATAYALWPKGAAKLLAGPINLADTVICAAYDIESYQADPALVIQTDQGKIYNIPAPIQVAPAPLGQPKSDCIAILAPRRCCRTPHDFNCIGF